MSKKNIRVIVGMSGGVDSSVAAFRLLQEGYDVHGMFMKNWEDDDTDSQCTAEEDRSDAKVVCETLGIPLHHVNFSQAYKEQVFAYFLQEYKAGRTPNPDILCNREIKFKSFLDYAKRFGADFIATGHYVRREDGDECKLLRGIDSNKDQSYFLYTLQQHQLRRSLFPIGNLEKPRVRELAAEIGLPNHDKKDSTGICFIGERDFREFLQRYIPSNPGNMVTPDGEVIGKHVGLSFYTLGQRKGLGIGGVKGAEESPWFVVGKNLTTNELIVTQGHDHPLLQANGLTANQLSWVSDTPPAKSFHCTAKTRYRQQDIACKVVIEENDAVRVEFASPQRAVTPGQSVVFYQGEVCLGGGVIDQPFNM